MHFLFFISSIEKKQRCIILLSTEQDKNVTGSGHIIFFISVLQISQKLTQTFNLSQKYNKCLIPVENNFAAYFSSMFMSSFSTVNDF